MTLERFNELSNISFPIKENASKLGTDGNTGLILPNNFLLDLQLAIYTRGAGSLELVSIEVAVDGSNAVVSFRYTPVSGAVVNMSQILPGNIQTLYQGSVHSDDLDLVTVWGPGVATVCDNVLLRGIMFLFSSTQVEPSCVFIRNNHVVKTIDSPSDVALSGDVKIMPGYSMLIGYVPGTNTIRLSAAPGEGQGIPCNPGDNTRNCEELVYRINGMSPDWTGDFILEGGPGIQIIPDLVNHKIIIKTSYKACSPGCSDPIN